MCCLWASRRRPEVITNGPFSPVARDRHDLEAVISELGADRANELPKIGIRGLPEVARTFARGLLESVDT
jgi:hypothetical protein